jgi:hypothetical protein
MADDYVKLLEGLSLRQRTGLSIRSDNMIRVSDGYCSWLSEAFL